MKLSEAKKYSGYFLLLLLASACNGGSVNNNDNYANFEIIDQEVTNESASEIILVSLTKNAFNSFNPMLGFQTEPGHNALSISKSDSLNVNINNSQTSPLSLLAAGFYNYINQKSINYVNMVNPNSYSFTLKFNNNTYLASIANIPQVYTVEGGSCSMVEDPVDGIKDTLCNITTTNFKIPYQNATITYALSGAFTGSCLGTVQSQSIDLDVVRFSNCQIFNDPQIQLQLAIPVTLTNSSSDSFNMEGQYYFLSPKVNVIEKS